MSLGGDKTDPKFTATFDTVLDDVIAKASRVKTFDTVPDDVIAKASQVKTRKGVKKAMAKLDRHREIRTAPLDGAYVLLRETSPADLNNGEKSPIMGIRLTGFNGEENERKLLENFGKLAPVPPAHRKDARSSNPSLHCGYWAKYASFPFPTADLRRLVEKSPDAIEGVMDEVGAMLDGVFEFVKVFDPGMADTWEKWVFLSIYVCALFTYPPH